MPKTGERYQSVRRGAVDGEFADLEQAGQFVGKRGDRYLRRTSDGATLATDGTWIVETCPPTPLDSVFA